MNPQSGISRCSRYAFAPNYYHYCGPERQNDLFGYIKENHEDKGLADILERFETLYPYLRLIAAGNAIRDPFDPRVVEAYWIGNAFTNRINPREYAVFLSDVLGLVRKIPKKDHDRVFERIAHIGVPTHTDHVFSIFLRTGHHAITHTLETMDQCRISWGKVIEALGSNRYIVRVRPLQSNGVRVSLGSWVNRVVTGLTGDILQGEWVSIHWGYICDVLSEREKNNLMHFTHRSLAVYEANL